MTPRRGFTLVELCVSITLGTVVLGLAMGLVHRAMRLESIFHERADVNRNIRRLTHDFRHDVHSASSLQLVEDGAQFELSLSLPEDRSVRYTLEGESVRRSAVLTSGSVQKEFYTFADNIMIEFATADSSRWVTLTILRDPRLKAEAPRVLAHVVAEMSHRARIAAQPSEVP